MWAWFCVGWLQAYELYNLLILGLLKIHDEEYKYTHTINIYIYKNNFWVVEVVLMCVF